MFLSYEEAVNHPNAFLYLDCENEIPLTCPIRYVKCPESALVKLCDDLGYFGLLTDATGCIFYGCDVTSLGDGIEVKDGLWMAPLYEQLGPAIRKVLSGAASDLFNDAFDPCAHFFRDSNKPGLGETPLYLAVTSLEPSAFERMLPFVRNIDAANTNGTTPLCGAVRRQNEAMVKRLLELGASPNTRDSDGKTPLHHALFEGSDQPAVQIVRMLLKANADVNATDKWKRTPLDDALRWAPESVEVHQMLIARGARRGKELIPK